MPEVIGKVSEVFRSIQGEGIYQGVDQVFVRFFGCNLKCSFCDTKLDSYEKKTAVKLFDEVSSFSGYHSLSITGGEPLVQADFLKDLLKLVKKQEQKACPSKPWRSRVYLETNGTLPENLEKVIEYVDIIAMDFKLPSSTGLKLFWDQHQKFLKIAKEKKTFVKAVIGTSTTVEDVYKTIEIIKGSAKKIILVLQPQNPFEVMVKAKINSFKQLCQEEGLEVKVIPQMHKKLGLR